MDLKGLTGTSLIYYFASFKTDNRAKLEEIKNGIETSLFYNDTWRHNIKDIIQYVEMKKSSTITIFIYNKDDLLETIWKSKVGNPIDWIPLFYIVVDPNNNEDAEIFKGNIIWKQNDINLTESISETFNGFNNYLVKRHFGEQRVDNNFLMSLMGFEYQIDYLTINTIEEKYKKNIVIRGNRIIESTTNESKSFTDFLNDNTDVATQIVNLFENNHSGNGIFNF